jgi:periplasmic protein TonB
MKTSSNINRHQIIFFEIGLIVALSLSLMAFKIEGTKGSFLLIPEEPDEIMICTTPFIDPAPIKKSQKKKTPKKKQRVDFTRINLVNTVIPSMEPLSQTRSIPLVGIPKFVSHKVIDVDTVVISPDYMPEFPGGSGALMSYLQNEVKYPDIPREMGRQGAVWIRFEVDEEGNISSLKILKDEVGYGCAQEAIRVIRKMPRWKPGLKDGKKVKTRFIQSIRFELSF